MNNYLRALLSGLLTVFLAACSCGAPSSALVSSESEQIDTRPAVSDAEFNDFLDQILVEALESDYTEAHNMFVHPENYGVDVSKCEITLGHIITPEEEMEEEDDTLEKLSSWSPRNLSKGNRQIYEQLIWNLELNGEADQDEFLYLQQLWTPNSSPASGLITNFSEYSLYSEDDLQPLLDLINDCPRYIEECIDYTKEQVKRGLFATDLDPVMETIENTLKNKDDSIVTSSLDEQIDSLDLGEAKTKEWKDKIHQALNESFFPSFETMKSALEELEDENKPIVGLGSLDHGKELYSLIIKSYAGTDKTPDEFRYEISDFARDLASQYLELSEANENLSEDPQTPFNKISEIMPFLAERYPAAFPLVDELDYEIKPLKDEQSQPNVLAYFVKTPFDSTEPYKIRYNSRDYADDPSSLQLYDTFAHEGIPGHMYQQQYQKENFTHPIRYFLNSLATSEGYAVYAAYQTLSWTGIDEVDLDYYRVSDLYSNCLILLMDLSINYDGMSREEFVKTYGEANESLYDSLALIPGLFFSYYYGSLRFLELEEIAQEALGDLYDPVAFNESLLSPGNLNFQIITDSVQDYIDSIRLQTNDPNSSSASSTGDKPLPPTVSNKDKDRKKNSKASSEPAAEPSEETMMPFDE